MNIGQKILFTRRFVLNATQEELAGLAGVHRNTIIAIERGDLNIKFATIIKICEAAGVTIIAVARKCGEGMNQCEHGYAFNRNGYAPNCLVCANERLQSEVERLNERLANQKKALDDSLQYGRDHYSEVQRLTNLLSQYKAFKNKIEQAVNVDWDGAE